MSKIKATITHGKKKEIRNVCLLHESNEVVIILVQTNSKVPQLLGLNHVIYHFEGGDTLRLENLPFNHAHVIYTPDRYDMHIAIYNFYLLEKLSANRTGSQILYDYKEPPLELNDN